MSSNAKFLLNPLNPQLKISPKVVCVFNANDVDKNVFLKCVCELLWNFDVFPVTGFIEGAKVNKTKLKHCSDAQNRLSMHTEDLQSQ